ncbi:hypothetical protein F0562_025408 [Nyssa sinensis]|uniref:Uncharacterized protein n=1 Tax=Nyssa sinensis TaxID=561372 RepID=A0A5J5BE66_9ASTE|nr:hypothetical protein F0562_025408 [Nyssa sinensis]
MSRKKKPEERDGDGDEVAKLLQAAEDEILLKLSLNSHMSHGSAANSYIDPDLDRRFLALKSSSSSASTKASKSSILAPKSQSPAPAPEPAPRTAPISDNKDDLFAKFAALKSSLPSSSSTSLVNCKRDDDLHDLRPNNSNAGRDQGNDDIDEDEVQKVIQWAMDAARLDPSPPSDTGDDGNNDDYSDDDDDSDGEKKGRRKYNIVMMADGWVARCDDSDRILNSERRGLRRLNDEQLTEIWE